MLQENNQRILEESKFDHLESSADSRSCIFPHALQERMKTPTNQDENASLTGLTATVGEMTPSKVSLRGEIENDIKEIDQLREMYLENLISD